MELNRTEYVVVHLAMLADPSRQSGTVREWVAASIPVHRLLRSAGLDRLPDEGYEYQLTHLDRRGGPHRLFARSPGPELIDPIAHTIHPGDQRWQLSIAPRAGWLAWLSLLQHGVLVGILALSTALSIYELSRRADRFRGEADRHRDSLVQANKRLTEEIQVREELERQFDHIGFRDVLTGLPNRRRVLDRLELSLRRARQQPGYRIAIIALDLDRFKNVNESLGYEAGDQLLIQAARRLESCLPSDETMVARLGGDEFALLIFDLHHRDAALAAVERVRGALSNPFELAGGNVFVSASMGLAFNRSGYDRADELLREADIALSKAKAEGPAHHAEFEPEAREEAASHLQLTTDLRRAIQNREFELHYQPIVSLKSGSIVGCETLVRWRHPVEGMIRPDHFIGLAEETGLIVPITRWVLQEACRQAQVWRSQLPRDRDFYVGVNLAAQDLRQPDLGEFVGNLLAETGLLPHLFRLEITEGSLISNVGAASALLDRLRALGVALLLDDFGTGYSSLSYLQRFKFDYLKIDRSFTSRIGGKGENAAIVQAIIDMARNLDMRTVAEGIESRQIADRLRAMGCDYGQGYYFSRPVNRDAATKLLLQSKLALQPA